MSEQPPQPPYGQPTPPYGQPTPQYGQPGGYVPPPPTPSGATTSLILGIISVAACIPFLGIPAIIIGRNAMREIDASQGKLGGRSSAQAGFILGIVGTVIMVLAVLAVILLIALGAIFADSVSDLCTDVSSDPTFAEVEC